MVSIKSNNGENQLREWIRDLGAHVKEQKKIKKRQNRKSIVCTLVFSFNLDPTRSASSSSFLFFFFTKYGIIIKSLKVYPSTPKK